MKLTSKELELTPDDIPNRAKAAETIKRLLSNLATITQGVTELRNQYGTGHGKTAGAKGLKPRHAKLAVGAASTLAVFLAETHAERPTRADASGVGQNPSAQGKS
ncbi:MAG: abortive infection family protein [Gammaproteobacteria bacterium]